MLAKYMLTAVLLFLFLFLFVFNLWGQSEQSPVSEAGAGKVDIQWNDATRPDLFRPDPVLLARYVGVWESTEEEDDGTQWREEWRFDWNDTHTFLDYCTVVERNGEPYAVGVGFLMYDVNTSSYRLYLMVDNGALHESIGREIEDGRFEYTMETYGNPKFATTTMELAFTPSAMSVTYTSVGADGTESRQSYDFGRKE